MGISASTRRHFVTRVLALGSIAGAGLLHAPGALCRELGTQLKRIKGRIVRRDDADYPQWWSSMSWYMF